MKKVCFSALFLSIALLGCASLKPVSGGTVLPNGKYLINESESVQIEISRIAVGTQLARIEVRLMNNSIEPQNIDYTKTVIMTDLGEQLQPLDPSKAASSVSADAMSVAIAGRKGTQSAIESSKGEIMREGIGQATLQSKGFIQGVFFFSPPTHPYKIINVKFIGVPGNPEVSFKKIGE